MIVEILIGRVSHIIDEDQTASLCFSGLECSVQLVDNTLERSLLAGGPGVMQAGCEDGYGRTRFVTTLLKKRINFTGFLIMHIVSPFIVVIYNGIKTRQYVARYYRIKTKLHVTFLDHPYRVDFQLFGNCQDKY